MSVKIVVATHKEYPMPQDPIYLPLQVGAAVNGNIAPYQKDNTGKNISKKNPGFCELTALYWAWQNLDADYIGLVHYRRLLAGKNATLSTPQIQKLLQTTDIILPKKRHYYIENLYDHYKHTTYIEPLDLAGKIIRDSHPAYYPEFQNLHRRTSAHIFNIMIMKKDLLNDYCTWLFDILFELERRIGPTTYDQFHTRFYGRISELLLDIYLNTNHLPYKELPLHTTESPNWPKKIHNFLNAKYRGIKYETSS